MKLRRVNSAPAQLVSSPTPLKVRRVDEPIEVEDLNLAPARKKARVVNEEGERCARSKQLKFDVGEDQGQSRGRSKTRSCSRAPEPIGKDAQEPITAVALPGRPHQAGEIQKANVLTEQERHLKAKEWISKMKDTPGYNSYLSARQSSDRKALAAPRTPDPALRSNSKRKWERSIMSWRISLRNWGSVTVSTDDAV